MLRVLVVVEDDKGPVAAQLFQISTSFDSFFIRFCQLLEDVAVRYWTRAAGSNKACLCTNYVRITAEAFPIVHSAGKSIKRCREDDTVVYASIGC